MTAARAGWALLFRGGDLLVLAEGDAWRLPTWAEAEGWGLAIADPLDLHTHALPAWAAACSDEAPEPAAAAWRGLRGLYGVLDEASFALAGRAFQLLGWDRDHRFCGRCGARTVLREAEHARGCTACGALYFPRLNPAVIVRVERGDQVLLARSPHFRPGMYSVIAGFVEPGESLEQAVAREVREEVGVEVTDIRYFGSQPWPFPNSLMIGFTAQHASGDIRIDPAEIEDAGWFGAESMPSGPGPLSIARWLLDDFADRQGWPPGTVHSP
jgi:NAD+ diphosphatase